MINDQLRELRVRLDQIERIALAIPTKYWPDAFEAVLQGCEIMIGIAQRELDQDFSTKDRPKRPGLTDPGPRYGPTLTVSSLPGPSPLSPGPLR